MNKRLIYLFSLLLSTVFAGCKEYPIFVEDDGVYEPITPEEEEGEEDNWDGTFDESTVSFLLTKRAMTASYNTIFQDNVVQETERKGVLVSWRYLSSDPEGITFDLYRNGTKLNTAPIAGSSNYKDLTAAESATYNYEVKNASTGESLCTCSFKPEANKFYRSIPLNNSGLALAYDANDAAVGDLDGDGDYELVLKRQADSRDNGGTWTGIQPGTTLLEAYELDGTFLWRVDMGININSGAHYTPFIVYDFTGDGRAEVAFRSSEGTTFADGAKIDDVNKDGVIDYRDQTTGRVLSGPDFLSLVDGSTGTEIARADYIPRGDRSTWTTYWGDDWGNRSERFLMGVGHFGSQNGRAAVVICRGYYENYQVWTLQYTNGKLRNRWKFDTAVGGWTDWVGQGNHNLSIGDVDSDGKDEIVYGSCCIDDDGTGLYSTKLGHGDALHLGKFDPNRSGLQVVACHESETSHQGKGVTYRDAATGSVISYIPGTGDIGRCMVADVDPVNPGCEFWGSNSEGYLYSCSTGLKLETKAPTTVGGGPGYNMGIWWDGSLNRQGLDRAAVNSIIYQSNRLFTGDKFGVVAINGTKSNPCFYGDIWGDWREEMIYTDSETNPTELRIFTTDFETAYRFHPLMDDHIYRISAAHQNVGYNQPTHTGFYLGSD